MQFYDLIEGREATPNFPTTRKDKLGCNFRCWLSLLRMGGKAVSSGFQGNFNGVSRMFLECFKEMSGVFQGRLKMWQCSFKWVSRMFKTISMDL